MAGLSAKQQRMRDVARLLSQGYTATDTAKMLKISRNTVENYKSDPEFKPILAEANQWIEEAKQANWNRLHSYAQEAIIKLYNLLIDPEVPHREQLGAAKEILTRTGYNPENNLTVTANQGITFITLNKDDDVEDGVTYEDD